MSALRSRVAASLVAAAAGGVALAPALDARGGTTTSSASLSAEDLELVRYLELLEEMEMLERMELMSLLSALEDEEDEP